ncbi:acyloxyacyl hydrolase [Pedobacter insulae]|uniref:Lipid A 3-O-deacylase (PagL) n=1 Tax=Pedobacter insulae TaxID=414048 RepID=A0A1I2TUK4_9SPHI|nr:acyloxyacyl hydrolase [Pedobacter insulae]SFG65961.1 Lipid A 3-O-deacylase (PagL) [Pedobacter insulae]
MINKIIFAVIGVLSLIETPKLFAQKQGDSYEFRTVFGAHGLQDQGHLFQDKIYGADFIYNKSLEHDPANWIRHANAKSYGLMLVYRDFSRLQGMQDTITKGLGSSIGVVARLKIRLLELGKVKINFMPALGLSYVTKPYFTNKQNRYMGSHINETILGELEAEIPLSPKFSLLGGGSYLHHSNGGVVVPNGGLNTGNVYLGIKFNDKAKPNHQNETSFQTLRRNSFEIMGGFGFRGVFEKQRAKYRSGLYAGYNLYLNDLITLKTGLDAVYYFTTFDPNNNAETFQNYGSSYKPWRLGASVGTDVNVWRITINGRIGKYIYYDRYYKNATWYWAFGPTYFITPKLGIQASSYMHFAQADYMNYGIVLKI